MLPAANNDPPVSPKGAIDSRVPCDVSIEFRPPVRAVGPRSGAVRGTTVPEAPVDEHGNALPREDDVWPDKPGRSTDREVLPKPQPKSVKLASHRDLRLGISPPRGSHPARDHRTGRLGIWQRGHDVCRPCSRGFLRTRRVPCAGGSNVRSTSENPCSMTKRTLAAISLYSGAGGLDLGFSQAGFEILWAIDSDKDAVASYNANLGEHCVCGDVLATDPPWDLRADVVIGGPPCQGFSVIGRMDPHDPRSRHVLHFLDVVEAHEPRAFVMENVKALATSPRWATVRTALEDRASRLGYRSEVFVLNAADYGVPQARERMFFVGMRDAHPSRPPATTAHRPITVRETVSRLPMVGDPGNDGICTARVVPARRPVMRPTAYRGSLLFNGSGRPLFLDGVAKTLPASMGGNATPIIDQEELDDGSTPWVVEYHQRLMNGGRPLKRAPRRMRRITTQEAAALQTFPMEFVFHGPQGSRYRQIGNAVPPQLANAVASMVYETLKSNCDAEQPESDARSLANV